MIGSIALAAAGVPVVLAGWFVARNWAPDLPVAALAKRWAPPPSVFVPLQGMQVHLRDTGPRDDGLPIILIHGTSSDLHTWDGWVSELAATRRVVCMDLPGFGLTGPAPDDDYSPERYARFIVDLLDHLEVPRAILAGNSFGGGVAWFTAVVAPSRVARLVLLDSAGYPLASVSVPLGFRLARLPLLNIVGHYVLPRRLIAASVRNVYGDPARASQATIDRTYDMTRRVGNRAFLAGHMARRYFEKLSGRISEVTQPTLILWGSLDRLVAPANAERFRADIAHSELIMFDGLGHVPQEEAPEMTLAAALPFLCAAPKGEPSTGR